MLCEEQAAELLHRCERIAGRGLPQLRGNLRRPATRADAVWEMLVLEAASQLGVVECEAPSGGPDIRLQLPSGRWLSIEVTYLHPRFEDEEKRCNLVVQWMWAEEMKMVASRVAIECRFNGGRVDASGTRLTLPAEHQRKEFMANPQVAAFLAAVRAAPFERHETKLTDYTVTLSARPRLSESDRFTSSSRPALDSPTNIEEHAAFRALRSKVDQHKVDEPYVVCIGSDVSQVLWGTMGGFRVRLEDALGAAVRPSGRLSGILVVPIQSKLTGFGRTSKSATPQLFQVSNCRHPLADDDVQFLSALNLNRWKYTFPLATIETKPQHRRPRVSGALQITSSSKGPMKLSIPASLMVEVLAGRISLAKEYGDSFDPILRRCLQDGWTVVGCQFLDGNIEQGESGKVELELCSPHEAVFWGKRK